MKLCLVFLTAFLSTLPFTPSAHAMPAQIVIFRNAEKIRGGYELNERGWERAYGLVTFIKHNRNTSRFGKPIAIFSVRPQKNASLIRMRQTMIPLSQELRIPIQNDYDQNDIDKLVNTIRSRKQYNGKTVVICWQSDKIPELVRSLGLKHMRSEWRDAFDRAWILRYQDNRIVEFKDIPQRLLAGDSKS
jgi:hypothetical protein